MKSSSEILKALENESIEILRETAAAFRKPVLLYSIGKDSAVLLHLAAKAFYPAPIPFPVLHIDTTWKFKEMISFRNEMATKYGLNLIVHTNQAGVTGMFFSFLQIHQILGFDKDKSDALIQKLQQHVEQEKYTYHHDWQDGDIVLSEQWLSIHKRWRCENIQNRVVHRIALNFDHCDITNTLV